MISYLDIVQRVAQEGARTPNRTGIDTLAVPNVHFSHDMSEGFPLLTTKKMFLKGILVELEGFIGGITDKRWYKERGCNIWNEWANPVEVRSNMMKLGYLYGDEDGRKEVQRATQDLGPFYGYQWRRFNDPYADGKPISNKIYAFDNPCDQLYQLVKTLRENPTDRRMIVSAWNPLELHRMALPPCIPHWVVTVIDGHLNLHWEQRSCDVMLGLPFDIAHHATLLLLLARQSGFAPGNLSATLCNCHIYENHLEGAYEQLTRVPRELPLLRITTSDYRSGQIWDWEHTDVELTNYNPHPRINFGDIAV
jgi:thymidylate synthase